MTKEQDAVWTISHPGFGTIIWDLPQDFKEKVLFKFTPEEQKIFRDPILKTLTQFLHLLMGMARSPIPLIMELGPALNNQIAEIAESYLRQLREYRKSEP